MYRSLTYFGRINLAVVASAAVVTAVLTGALLVLSTAGNLAFPFSPSDIPMGEAYEFSVYHLMRTDPRALFPLTVCEVGSGGRAP